MKKKQKRSAPISQGVNSQKNANRSADTSVNLKTQETEMLALENQALLSRNVRIFLVRIVFIFGLIFLLYRIFSIKQTYGKEYEERAIKQLIEDNAESDQAIEPNRGSILDRDGNILATSRIVHTVFVDVKKALQAIEIEDTEKREKAVAAQQKEVEKIIGLLVDILGEDPGKAKDYFSLDPTGKPLHNTNYLVIQKELLRADGIRVEERIREESVKHVYLEDESIRMYPQNQVAAQIIGFVRGDSKLGLESSYNEALSGTPGRVFRTYSERGAVVTERIAPIEGHTLVTTLDMQIQVAAESIAKKYGDDYIAEEVGIIVTNPQTGEIIAMAEYPTFNLNEPADPLYLNDESLHIWKDLESEAMIENMNRVWNPSNTTFTFEPGSIFKPMTVAMALEEGIISTATRFHCTGKKVIGGWDIHCVKRSGHGDISLTESLALSCNVAMMEISNLVGRDIFHAYQTGFGFGEKTGIDLPYEANAKELMFSVDALNASELATSSFGQSFNATPIQNLMAFNATINGGSLLEPYLVAQMTDEKNELVKAHEPVVKRKIISQGTSDYMREALIDTVALGTGRKAQVTGYTIGGKTGTAEQGIRSEKKYALAFISYFPAENPLYSVMVYAYKPGRPIEELSITAMGKEMIESIIEAENLKPQQETADDIGEDLVFMEDLLSMTLEEASIWCKENHLTYEIIGNKGARISGQFPKAAAQVEKGSKVFLHVVDDAEVELVEIPDLIGMDIMRAREFLEALDIPYIEKEIVEYNPTLDGEEVEIPLENSDDIIILEQMPKGGTEIQKNVEIIIQPGILE